MREKIETYIVVTIIAALVWLYAEGENVRDYPREAVQVQVVAPSGTEMSVEPAEPQLVLMSVRASSGQMQALRRRIGEGPFMITVGENVSNGVADRTIVLQNALAQVPVIAERGINVLEVEPATINVHIERIVSRSLPVDVQAGDVQLAGQPNVEPAQVTITTVHSVAQQLAGQRTVADLTRLDLSALEPNVSHTLDVPVELPFAADMSQMRVDPGSVLVTLTIRKVTDRVTLTSIPVNVSLPPRLLSQYNLQLDEDQLVVRDVVLEGPAEVIERIRNRQAKVWAELRPTADQLDAGVESVPLYLSAPAGVTLVTPLPQASIRVERRE